jgi:chloramphenicol 3-O-phosphotransferase
VHRSAALLITGTVGAGKTTVADALGDLLAKAGTPHAVIDVDWLRRAWPAPPGDPFQSRLTLRNLRDVAANFRDAGLARLVLAGVVETRAQRDEYRDALGLDLTVCRLRVAPDVLRQRLTRRHENDPGRLPWHLDRAPELDGILDRAGVEDVIVDATKGTPYDTARAVAAAVGW